MAESELMIRVMMYHLLNPNLDLAVRQKDSGARRQLDPVTLLPPRGESEEEEEGEFYIRVLTASPWVESLGQHSKYRDPRVKGHLCLVCTC